jgi:nucleoside-diphosphate-sugar epimerase
MVDETYHMPASQDFLTEYDRTKWMAHYEVALPMMERGAPVVIVQPGAVYGPGDQSLLGDMMRRYYDGRLPFPLLPGPEATLTFAHVDDIAEGHILAAEKGRPGESYIITGPAAPMGEMVKIWSRVTGKREPILQIPARFVKPFAPVMDGISRIIPLPEIFSRDSLIILDATYTARPDKARQELGWSTRPVEEGMRQTFEWIAHNQDPSAPEKSTNRWIVAGFAVTAALSVLLLWLVSRRDRED